MELWFTEKYRDVAGLTIRVRNHLYHSRSRYQQIDVFETEGLGKMLVLDGLVMLTEKDEFVYHEALVHPAMIVATDVKKVLVVGGGDGGSVREILKYEDVEKVDVVEIDEEVIEVSRRFFPELAQSFNSPKVAVHNRDILDFVKDCPESYDVIILDTSDPVGPAEGLYSENFYSGLKGCLGERGVVAIQSESPWWHRDVIVSLSEILKKEFGRRIFYTAPVLSYPGGLWLFSIAGDNYDLTPKRKIPPDLKFIKEEFLDRIYLPPFIEELL